MVTMIVSLALVTPTASAVNSPDYDLPFDGEAVYTIECGGFLTVEEPIVEGDVVDWQYWLNAEFFAGTRQYPGGGWGGEVGVPFSLPPGDHKLELDLFDSTGFHETVDYEPFSIDPCEEEPAPAGVSVFDDSQCETLVIGAPTGIQPEGADWQYFINAEMIGVGEYELSSAEYTLTLDVNGVTVDTDPVTITECDEEPVPPGLEVLRWFGADRYETAASLAANGNWTAGGTVYIATGQTAMDALVVSGAASGFGATAVTPAAPGPILLTKQNQLPQATRGALTELAPANIVLVGGTSAASAAVEKALGQYAPTTRVAGGNRYETAAQIALQNDREVVYVVSGDEAAFPDALSVAPLARWQGGAVLLAKQDSLPSATRDALVTLQPGRVVVVGGSDRVSDSVAQAAAEAAGRSSFERLAGDNRYATSQRVAQEFPSDVPTSAVYLATGTNFPDALGAGALAGSQAAPVLLVQPNNIPTGTVRAIEWRMPEDQVVLVGGPAAVSAAVEAKLRDLFE